MNPAGAIPPGSPDKGMYFIWDFTQLNVRPHSRVGLLKYKTAPKCSLSGPFRHSGVGRNPGVVGPVRSYNLNFTYPYQPREPRHFSQGGCHAAAALSRSPARARAISPLRGTALRSDSVWPRA